MFFEVRAIWLLKLEICHHKEGKAGSVESFMPESAGYQGDQEPKAYVP